MSGGKDFFEDAEWCEAIGIVPHPGYHGAFTRREALGCWRNGTAVVKIKEEPGGGERNAIGAIGRVLGSLSHPRAGTVYFVEWDRRPREAVLVSAWKLAVRVG